jgi:hypothetical protein
MPPRLLSAPRARTRPWVGVADVIALLLLALSLRVLLFGGFRIVVFGLLFTVHSSLRILILAAVVLAGRHALQRQPSMLDWLRTVTGRFVRAESVQAVAPSFLWTRLGVLLAAYLAVITIGYPQRVPFRASRNEFANLPARWDAGWYAGIAQEGYRYDPRERGQQNPAFFPAFPMATRAAAVLTGGHVDVGNARYGNPMRLLWAGVIVSLAALAGALGYLYRMVRGFADRTTAIAAVQFALAYPTAFVFNAPYTEAMFLLATVATFYHFGRRQLVSAAAWGALAGLTRPNGFLLTVPLLAVAVVRSGPVPWLEPLFDRLNASSARKVSLIGDVGAALAPVAGMLIFSIFLYFAWGDPFLWAKLHAAWGRTYQGLHEAVGPVGGIDVLNVLFFLLALSVSIPIAWRLGLAYSALIVITIMPPLLAGGWLSMARLTLVLFPIYVYLAVALPAAHRVPLMIAFAALQGFGAALFFTWRPFY